MTTPRDTAVAIATRLFQKLFERTWIPWSPTMDRAVARMFDALIEAAGEYALDRLRTERPAIDPFEQELHDLAGDAYTGAAGYTGETFAQERRTQELTPEERGMADFERWKRRREREGA